MKKKHEPKSAEAGRIYGYVRVSTRDQNEARQIDAMEAFGVHEMYVDKLSGKDFNRPRYQAMLKRLAEGDVLVVIDCCGSGGAIGRSGTTADVLEGIDGVFSGMAGPSVFEGSRYRVLASASIEQDSYRIGFEDREGESAMATAFARAVCEGCGWSIEGGSRVELLADANADGQISLDELYRYTARRVTAYLALGQSEYVQTVRVSPEGDVRALFGRTEDEGDEG
jgi:hypothetical protein